MTILESRPVSGSRPPTDGEWQPVCPIARLLPERGVAALFGELQIAVFLVHTGELFAIGNIDPFTGAAVLSRGIVGSRGGRATVSSPLHKQVFDLATGRCLDDEAVSVPSYPVRVREGLVEVIPDPRAGGRR